MQERNIWNIKAGIEYEANLNQFSYMTDKTPADVKSVFARINYGGNWTDGDHDANWHHNHYMRNQASRYFLAYHRKDHTRFVLRLTDSKQRNKIDFIVCERYQIPDISPKDIRSNMLYQIIAHNCARDMEATIQQISYAVTEARAVTNLNITVPHRKPDYKTFFPDMSEFETTFNLLNSRKKRSFNNEDEDSFKDANQKNEDKDSFKDANRKNEDKDSFKDANRKKEDENSFKDANRKNEDKDSFKDANRKNEDEDSFNETIWENGKYVHTKMIKKTIFSNRTKRYLIPPLMYPMAASLQQEIANHAQEMKENYLRTNRFCNGPCTESNEYNDIHMQDSYKHQLHSRSKRAFPLIPLAIGVGTSLAAANVISSAVSRDAPLSWFG
jgi:hypothetical protein